MVAAGARRAALAGRAQAAAIRAGMSPGGRNAGSSRSITRAQHRPARPRRPATCRSPPSPRAAQARTDSWSSHRPITLRRNRIVPSMPVSLVKLAARLASVSTGAVELHPDQRPGAAGDVGEAAAARARPPLPMRCRATRRASTGTARQARSPAEAAAAGRRRRPRAGAAAATAPAGCRAGRARRPRSARDIEELRGGGVGDLGADLAGEPVAEQVGDQQQGARGRELGRAARRRAGRAC